jgi:hypothetical protein
MVANLPETLLSASPFSLNHICCVIKYSIWIANVLLPIDPEFTLHVRRYIEADGFGAKHEEDEKLKEKERT